MEITQHTITGTEASTTQVTGIPNTITILIALAIVCALATTLYMLYRKITSPSGKRSKKTSAYSNKNTIKIYVNGFAAPIVTDTFRHGETIVVGRQTQSETEAANSRMSRFENFIATDDVEKSYRKIGIPCSNDLKSVSREQLTIYTENDSFFVTPGSRNKPSPGQPILVNDEPIHVGSGRELKNGDIIYIGKKIRCVVNLANRIKNNIDDNSDDTIDDKTTIVDNFDSAYENTFENYT